MRTNLGLVSDTRIVQKFGTLSAGVRDLARGMLELDRASELKLLRDLLEKAPNEVAGESRLQRWTRGLAIGASGSPDSYSGRLSADYERQNMAANYAKLGAANSYEDFAQRTEEIAKLAEGGNIDEVTKKLEALRMAMTGDGSKEMKKDLLDYYTQVADAAKKAAEVEAQNNGSARAAVVKYQTNQIVTGYTQQAQLSQAIVAYGENSAKIEGVRARHAREALEIKLEEMGADLDGIDALRARAALEVQLAAQADVARQKRQKDQAEYFAELQREAELSEAILQFGADAAEVEALRARHAQDVLQYKLQEKGWAPEMIASALAMAKAEQDRQQAIKATTALRQSNQELDRLRLELSLIGQTERARQRALAVYDAELEIRRQGLDVAGAEADALRRNAVLTADLTARKDRLAAAWDSVTQAGEAAIDGVFDRLEEGDWKGAISEIAQEIGTLYKELAITNPIKNALLGTNYSTLGDVGGLGGIWGRLTGKAGSNAMSASAMSVTTPVVNLTAGAIAGLGTGAMSFAQVGGASAGLGSSTDVQQQVWSFFSGKGLKPHQIAGIMGNVSAESGFNPLAVGDGGAAFGLFQHNDRAPALFNAIGGMGNLGNVRAQLEFAWQELLTSENGPLKRLLAAPDLYSATHAFTGFERPSGYDAANPSSAAGWSQRLAAAEAAMARFGATTTSATQDLDVFGAGAQQIGAGAQQIGTGLGAFGSSLASMIQGVGAQHGIGGAVAGTLLTSLGSFLGIPGFATGGQTPEEMIAVSAGEYYIPAAIARGNVRALQAINTGRQLPAGLITGPGTGTSDSIMMPARAGDYIVNAAATARNRPLLDAMVAGKARARFAAGGQVASRSSIQMPAVAAAAAASEPSGAQSASGSDQRVTFEINVAGTGDRQIQEGVTRAIAAAFDVFTRDALHDQVRLIMNDKWMG
ncbi:MAG: phage tail tip lysozyme [Pseudodonghicola sp.]